MRNEVKPQSSFNPGGRIYRTDGHSITVYKPTPQGEKFQYSIMVSPEFNEYERNKAIALIMEDFYYGEYTGG